VLEGGRAVLLAADDEVGRFPGGAGLGRRRRIAGVGGAVAEDEVGGVDRHPGGEDLLHPGPRVGPEGEEAEPGRLQAEVVADEGRVGEFASLGEDLGHPRVPGAVGDGHAVGEAGAAVGRDRQADVDERRPPGVLGPSS